MSLQVWLPLTRDINSQGLCNISTTSINSASIATGGKLGGCLSLSSDGQAISLDSYMDVCSAYTRYSMSAWIYMSSAATNHSSSILSSGDWNTGGSNFCFGLYSYSSDGYYKILVPNRSTWSDGISLSSPIKLNTWYNICITYDGSITRGYVNGEYVGSYAGGYITPSSETKNLYVGSATYYPGFTLKGSINDVRIYDHCLSAKEVKEISKGLICHYKLSNPYETGQSNKYSGAVAEGRLNNGPFAQAALENERGYNYKFNYTGNGNSNWPSMNAGHYSFTVGKRYYYSCKVRCHSANFSMQLRASRSENDWVTNMTSVISSSSADGEWHEYVVSQVVNSTYDRSGETITCNPVLEFYTENLSAAGKVYSADFDIKDVQVIESDCYVPFIDNSMSTTVVSDCSGLRNNGTKVGNITYKDGSIRYEGCYTFTGDDYIKIPKPLTISNSSYFTISMWVKPESGCGNYSTILSNFSSPDSGFWMAINAEGAGTWFYNGAYAKGNSLLAVGQWSHIAMVFNAGTITWYTNGVATSTSNVSSNTTQFSDYIAIGNSYTGTSWNTDFVGNISDVRIYSTVLSAEYIKELYNTPASVDKNGNMYAYEFKEE